MDEKRLVEKCCRNDQIAWREFTLQYYPIVLDSVKQVFYRYKSSVEQDQIEDVCQQVFVKLLQNNTKALRNFMWKSSLKTWLSVVASSCAIDHLRKLGRYQTVDIDKLQNLIELQENSIPDENDVSSLKKALQLLQPRDQLIIKLAYHKKSSYEQISRLLGISVNTVGPALSRAVERLKKIYTTEKSGAR